MVKIYPIDCTEEEYRSARAARTKLIEGARAVKITIDGDLTEFTLISLPQLNETIAGMQMYRNSVEASSVVAFCVHGTKGF